MAEGWKQLVEDLRGALGLRAPRARARANGGEAPTLPAAPGIEPAPVQAPETEPRRDDGAHSASLPIAPAEQVPLSAEPSAAEETAPEAKPLTLRQRLYSYAGVAATLLLALGIGWYAYFGGPKPPAPDVVATFDGGQITIQQVRDYVARLTPAPLAGLGAFQSYETYRAVIGSMVLDELARRWAEKQQMDRETKLTDAMRHVSESVTLDEWIAELHTSEMMASVRESDIQAYYEANKAGFGDATLSEVRETIRETLAHQNQERFFQDYIASLRAEATIVRNYELLDVSAPTEAQIREYYEANRAQFAVPQRALVDMIFVPISASGDEANAEARARAEAALAALKIGKDFAEVAAQYSQEPYSAVGITIEAGKDDLALGEQAFALVDEGDLSPVFRTQTSYYVLRLREQQPARTLSPDEARMQIIAALGPENERAWFEQNADRTLFTIHGERYTLGQFYHEYQNLPPEFQTQFAGVGGMRQLAELLIDRLLVLDDAYSRLLDQKSTPLVEDLRALVLRRMMHEAEVDTQVAVTDQQVKDYYEQHKELFASPPEARIRAIRIYLEQTDDDRQRAWDRAEAAYEKLTPGFGGQPADFEAVAQEYDEAETDPTDTGLGEWIRMGDDVLQNLSAHPLHAYLLNLPVSSVSQPFEFGDSVYIVKILERTDPVPLPFEQVKDFIRPELEAQQHEQLDAELAERLLREARFTFYEQVIQQMLEADRATQAAP